MVFASVPGTGQKADKCMARTYDPKGFMSDGTKTPRCKNSAKPGSRYCGRHQPSAVQAEVKP